MNRRTTNLTTFACIRQSLARRENGLALPGWQPAALCYTLTGSATSCLTAIDRLPCPARLSEQARIQEVNVSDESKVLPEALTHLRQKLTDHFSEEELRILCFDMGIDYQDLPGEGKAVKVVEFILYLERRQRLPELVKQCSELRPQVSWSWQEPSRAAKLPAVSDRQRTRLFISYKRHVEPDQRLAAYLYQFLSAQGHDVFMDATLRTGEAWLEEIDQQIKVSDFLIVLLSQISADSEMVQAEVSRAYEYRCLQGHPRILPVRIAYEGLLPYTLAAFLNPLQYVVWRGATDDERVSLDVLAAIQGRLLVQSPIQARPAAGSVAISEDGRIVADDDALHPPLPEFDPRCLEELEEPGGAVKLRDKFYIEREADARLKREMMKQGSTVTIRAARQTGKSSLLARGIHHASERGAKVVHLDVQRVDQEYLGSSERFLRYLAESIIRRLRLDGTQVEKAWSGSLGPQDKLTYFMEDYVIPESDAPVILAMDEVDRLLQMPFHNDFFGMLRSWHNNRAFDDRWNKLNIVMVISTEPHLLITDVQSPFNVGLRLYLEDFSEVQVRDLNQRHGLPVQEGDLARFMELLNGHPYLTRKALYALVTERWTLQDLIRVSATDQGPFGDHLRHLQWLLRDNPDLRETLKQVIRQGRCSDDERFFRLLRAGLVKGSGVVCRCRCDLYRMYFEDKL